MEMLEEYRRKRKIKKFEKYVDDVSYFLDKEFGEGYYIRKSNTVAYSRERKEEIDLEEAFHKGIHASYITFDLKQFSKKIDEENMEQEQMTLFPINFEATEEVIADLTTDYDIVDELFKEF